MGKASCWVLRQQARVWGLGFRCVAVPCCPSNQLLARGRVEAWFGSGVLVVGVGVGGCALFENYTVDASIFVVKLLRADGGCLGTRSR